ncbi:SRPBCC family protein [Sphingopyxis sp. PAMC25046]|uniref:SRPBCC family protein n=1 Tax=Sphingopyxis sp. PAMC25046 TaxID=2565556 RepID=UPI00109DA055|nr:SRPBCC family protein [Sphingopyxis sp. PAMC25046]QCB55720.1 SRPBCC family protein [Sphingopyxis sp. PAMC25046]
MSSLTDRLSDIADGLFTTRPSRRASPDPLTLAAVGAGLAATGIGLALWRRSRKRRAADAAIATDAPHWTLDKRSKRALFGKSVLINRPRDELFAAWKVERFPDFMENVVAVEALGGGTARWTIKAPLGREVHLVNSITKSVEGESISWQSEPESEIANSGEVRFADAPAGRGTYVTLILAYDPPAGEVGRLGARLLQREPEVQARRDLHRFKQLMETGEVTSNASPSARSSESPTEPHI